MITARERSGARVGISACAQAAGNTISFADCAIAAVASAHGFMVATRTDREFRGTGVKILNPKV